MTIRFEKVHGQSMTLESPTVTTKYRCTRAWFDPLPLGHAGGFFDWVADNALFVVPKFIDYNPMGRLWLKDIRITELIYGRHYDIECPYVPPDKAPPRICRGFQSHGRPDWRNDTRHRWRSNQRLAAWVSKQWRLDRSRR